MLQRACAVAPYLAAPASRFSADLALSTPPPACVISLRSARRMRSQMNQHEDRRRTVSRPTTGPSVCDHSEKLSDDKFPYLMLPRHTITSIRQLSINFAVERDLAIHLRQCLPPVFQVASSNLHRCISNEGSRKYGHGRIWFQGLLM